MTALFCFFGFCSLSLASTFIALPDHVYTTFKESTVEQAVLNLKAICKKEDMNIDQFAQSRLICSRPWSNPQKTELPNSIASKVINPKTTLVFAWAVNQGNIDVDASLYVRYQTPEGKSSYTIGKNQDDLRDLKALIDNH